MSPFNVIIVNTRLVNLISGDRTETEHTIILSHRAINEDVDVFIT